MHNTYTKWVWSSMLFLGLGQQQDKDHTETYTLEYLCNRSRIVIVNAARFQFQ